jgi:hypothetical protein
MISHPPSSLSHTEHVHSLTGETTTSSGGRLCRSARRARFRSDSSGETQCVRYARSIPGASDFENRSGRRSRVRATYPVSLGSSPRAFAQRRKHRIAVEHSRRSNARFVGGRRYAAEPGRSLRRRCGRRGSAVAASRSRVDFPLVRCAARGDARSSRAGARLTDSQVHSALIRGRASLFSERHTGWSVGSSFAGRLAGGGRRIG